MHSARLRPQIWLAAVLTAALLALSAIAPASAETAVVVTDTGCLRLREAPSLSASILTCLDVGTTVEVTGGAIAADGYSWRPVAVGALAGWVAEEYLVFASTPAAPALPAPIPNGPAAFIAPPEGGLTIGIAGTTSMDALVAAQAFPVASVAVYSIEAQRAVTYLPGAPPFVNVEALGLLQPSSTVLVRRDGIFTPGSEPTSGTGASEPVGTPYALVTPPRGGITAGVAGTNDPEALIAAQAFAVDSVTMLEVDTQRWLTYLPSAPAFVNTLTLSSLRLEAVVLMRRSATAPDPVVLPPPPTGGGTTGVATVTYYYCTQGTDPRGIGDGGGFCGFMASGKQVYAGAAACHSSVMGQRFRIGGDPTGRVYTCEDTGGGVGLTHRDIWFANSDEGYAWWTAVGPTALIEVVD